MNYKDIFIKRNLIDINNFFNYMQDNFYYGWIDKNKNRHYGVNDADSYRLQSPIELLESHLGICWDMTELYRCFFEHMTSLKYETYYLFYDDNKGCPSHSILVFYNNNKTYWFEPMINDKSCYYSGIHEYNNISDLLRDLKDVFIKFSLINNLIPVDYDNKNFKLYKYKRPKYHINGHQVRDHIDNSIEIKIY